MLIARRSKVPLSMLLVTALTAVAMGSGCSAVTEQYVRPDFEAVHKTRVWRIHIDATAIPADHESVGKLWTLIAQRWINHHRDFIAKARSVAIGDAAGANVDAVCTGNMAGLLTLKPEFSRVGDDVSVTCAASLLDCKDRKPIWAATAAGTWGVDDDELKTTTDRYAKNLGESVRPWVPATFRLLRELLDTLPRPKLKDDDAIMEKIELDD